MVPVHPTPRLSCRGRSDRRLPVAPRRAVVRPVSWPSTTSSGQLSRDSVSNSSSAIPWPLSVLGTRSGWRLFPPPRVSACGGCFDHASPMRRWRSAQTPRAEKGCFPTGPGCAALLGNEHLNDPLPVPDSATLLSGGAEVLTVRWHPPQSHELHTFSNDNSSQKSPRSLRPY